MSQTPGWLRGHTVPPWGEGPGGPVGAGVLGDTPCASLVDVHTQHTQGAHGSSHACSHSCSLRVRLGKYGITVFTNIPARRWYRILFSRCAFQRYRISQCAGAQPLPLSQVRMCKINTGFLTCASHRYRNFSVRMRTDSNVILTAHRAVTVIPGAQAHHKSSNSRCASQLPYFQMRMRISGTVFSGAHHTITVYPRAHAHSSIVVPREQVPYFQMRMRASATVNAKAHHTAIP